MDNCIDSSLHRTLAVDYIYVIVYLCMVLRWKTAGN